MSAAETYSFEQVSRPRDNSRYRSVQRQLWEKVA